MNGWVCLIIGWLLIIYAFWTLVSIGRDDDE